jgi:hypothetical protein
MSVSAQHFPKLTRLNLQEGIDEVIHQLSKLGVKHESELEYLTDDSFQQLALLPVSQGKIRKLASTMTFPRADARPDEPIFQLLPQAQPVNKLDMSYSTTTTSINDTQLKVSDGSEQNPQTAKPISSEFGQLPPELHKTVYTANHFSNFMMLWQAVMIVIFCTCTTFAENYMPSFADTATSTTSGAHYPMFQDTHIMMAIGFGFLYTVMRRYAWSGVGINYLLCACTLQWAILCNGFWDNVRHGIQNKNGDFPPIALNLEALINGDYVVATILISFGALLGRLSPSQALLMAFLETIFVTGNVSLAIGLGISDAGTLLVCDWDFKTQSARFQPF